MKECVWLMRLVDEESARLYRKSCCQRGGFTAASGRCNQDSLPNPELLMIIYLPCGGWACSSRELWLLVLGRLHALDPTWGDFLLLACSRFPHTP